MSNIQDSFQELASLLADVQRDFPRWEQDEVISQIRRSMPEYRDTIWRIALPFNVGESDLPDTLRERFDQLRRQAAAADLTAGRSSDGAVSAGLEILRRAKFPVALKKQLKQLRRHSNAAEMAASTNETAGATS